MNKLITLLLVSCVSVTQLTACGFALRGYHTPDNHLTNLPSAVPVTLFFGNNQADFAVKRALRNQLEQLNIAQSDTSPLNATANTTAPSIQVSNITLNTYQLRGILTEIRMVLSADVRYHILQNGTPKFITNTIQVQRSYQYNQASVSTDNPQAEQIKVWLYDNLAQRIADQYLAINLTQSQAKH